jgi:hypothetical protein
MGRTVRAGLASALPANAESRHALPKLLAAKDCAVRAVLFKIGRLRDKASSKLQQGSSCGGMLAGSGEPAIFSRLDKQVARGQRGWA